MASNNEYKRYFIILQEDDKGYEMSPGKIPTGYVKIEVKNSKVRLNAFVQNVKVEDRIEYRLILVSSGKKLAVDVGKIIIDSSGRGELSHEFESDNVLKSGLNISDFTVAAVASGASVPLSGYTGRNKLEWKGKYEVVNRQKAVEIPRIDKKIKIEEIAPEIPETIAPPQPGVPLKPIMEPEMPVVEQAVNKMEMPVVEQAVNKMEMPVVEQAVNKMEIPVVEQAVNKMEIPVVEQPVNKMEMPVVEQAVNKMEMPVVEQPVNKMEMPIVEQPVKEPEMPMEIPTPVENIPEPEPEPVVFVQQPVEHTHIHESNVEVKIVIPQCPPMAPMEEPCEVEKEKIEHIEHKEHKEHKEHIEHMEHMDIKQYYYDDEEDESDRDSDSDSDEKKHHEEKEKFGHEISPYYSGNMYSRMKRVLRRLRRYEPFEKEGGYNWFKVGEDIYEINSVMIPYMGYMVPMGYPFMAEGCSMMMDRKGYILGVKYDDKDDDDHRRLIRYLLFGVPAIYSKRNEQYYRSRGFMEFRPHKSKGYGYFIMCLDIRNGMLFHMD